jgi:adenylate cyclase class IV
MTKTIQILLFSILILTCNSANSQKRKNEIILKSNFTLVQDTISINANGEMTHALKFKDKYYVLYEQRLLKYGGYGKRWLYVLKNGNVETIIDCPKELETTYLDFYVKNDSIIIKPYLDEYSFSLNVENYSWNKINKTDDLIFEDSDFYVYSLDFGEWGGKTWFKDKRTGSQYVLESTTPLINKIDKTYYLTNSFRVLRINNPKELTKCDSDVTYENIEKSGKSYSWYSQPIGFEVIYEDKDIYNFDFLYHPNIVSSFVFKNELLHIYETDTATYLSRIENNKIQPIEKILDDSIFFNWYYSYRCKNLNKTNELLKFRTKNNQINGLTTIDGNQIHVTYLFNKAELKPKTIGIETSNEIFKNRLKSILANFTKLTLAEIQIMEKEWKTFDITPNHKIGIDDSWNPHNYEIDINKSYLIIEDAIISNAIMYYATKKTDLVRAITINWESTQTTSLEFENEKSERKAFLTRFNELVLILTNEFGKPNTIKRKKKNPSLTWTMQNSIVVEIALFQQENYNNIRMEIYERK